jgi:allophanate hydrolase
MVPPPSVDVAVVGAHLSGQPLNRQLTDRDAVFARSTSTRPCYRLFALATDPPKPGLVRGEDGEPGLGAIEVEIWTLGLAEFGSFVSEIPTPLTIGRILLQDHTEVAGFLCEGVATAAAADITRFGGWRAYLAAATEPM